MNRMNAEGNEGITGDRRELLFRIYEMQELTDYALLSHLVEYMDMHEKLVRGHIEEAVKDGLLQTEAKTVEGQTVQRLTIPRHRLDEVAEAYIDEYGHTPLYREMSKHVGLRTLVGMVLEHEPEARENYNVLVLKTFKYLGIDMDVTTEEMKVLPSMQSIVRFRRYWQNKKGMYKPDEEDEAEEEGKE